MNIELKRLLAKQRKIEADVIRGIRIAMYYPAELPLQPSELALLPNALAVIGSIVLCAFMLIVGCATPAQAEETIEGYTVSQYVQAIYLTEGGSRAEYPYGIRSVKCSTKQECERIARNTVKNNYKRYINYGHNQYSSYLEFLGSRFCPTTGNLSKREKEVNKNWIGNMRYFLKRGNL